MNSMELFINFINSLSEEDKNKIDEYNISGGGTTIYCFDIKAEDNVTVQFAFTESGNLAFIDSYK